MSVDIPTAGRPEIEAALLLLAKLGVTPTDLVAGTAANRPTVPTFAEFVPQVAAATSAGTLKACRVNAHDHAKCELRSSGVDGLGVIDRGRIRSERGLPRARTQSWGLPVNWQREHD